MRWPARRPEREPDRRTRRPDRRPARERGSASVWVLALVPLLLVATAAVGGVTQAISTRQQARSAADLAAAAATGAGPVAAACGRARAVALANGTRLVSCRLIGGAARVAVHATGHGWVAWLGGVTVTGVAGPSP